MDVFKLTDKNIFVTGASSGIGREIAISASKYGAKVIITGRNEERLNNTYSELSGEGHLALPADLTDEKQIAFLVDKLPKLHGVVFSAGLTAHMPAKFIRQANIDHLFNINFESPVLATGRLLKKRKILDSGSIVFLSSIGSKYSYFGGAMYSSSKAALETYSRVLASELAPKKIRANCLSPTFVKTPMVDGAEQTISKEVMDNFERMSPLGFGDPIDVANAAIFFLSDASRWITGTNLPLGGN
ncbi:MAG: SDR family oxidoreductase [Bacteroidetes bacterium]|jgi:NAD(P)-dependent dehydrogenase (short-subunit alcohol dehydrogenase family)|nr:SDR family oxidoreductase [Bacteroidota bacterium]MBT6687739.1 SDR family oxidoreductase [Bacteroidota bacterium]MBT7143373.1 SDR family oxidoreductase [Bacteroidota bacterium]MBT7490695.1 SDR family oxidoreductase [Bacteroidota bacterium]